MKKWWLIGVTFYFALLLFTRFYNLEHTARFTEDESGFLVRVHQIYLEKKLTLVGQINDQGNKVFSSTTVYLLLPFAAFGSFDPTSVFFGAAFYGVLTSIVMLVLAKKINTKFLWLAAILVLVWFPLVQMGRWAWNPNFIPLWISLGIVCYLQKRPLYYFLSGIFLGLSVHQHYYALFAIAAFTGIVALEAIVQKRWKHAILICLGVFLTLFLFVIFDLRHPPGFFFAGTVTQAQTIHPLQVVQNLTGFSWKVMLHHTQTVFLALLFALCLIGLSIFDLRKRNKVLLYWAPCAVQFLMIPIIGVYFPH